MNNAKGKRIKRRNFFLLLTLLVLVSSACTFVLTFAYRLTGKYVKNKFFLRKIDALEQSIAPYNDFFRKKIPEISTYAGRLDAVAAAKYARSVFDNYPFVERMVFYNLTVSNRKNQFTIRTNNLSIQLTDVFQFTPSQEPTPGLLVQARKEKITKYYATWSPMALKLINYVRSLNRTKVTKNKDVHFKVFYDVQPNKITYLNMPSQEVLNHYRQWMYRNRPSPWYQQNMMTFYLNPLKLLIKNPQVHLYQQIAIHPLLHDLGARVADRFYTEIAFPGALSNYKLCLYASKHFLGSVIWHRFLPVAASILFVYLLLLLVAVLIYTNMNNSVRLFQLQYDFINNFTHEVKTPLSVIKIAGASLASRIPLSNEQLMRYNAILDAETDKLHAFINQLLSLSQLEHKVLMLKTESIDIENFTRSQIGSFQLKYPDFQLSYTIGKVQTLQMDSVLLTSVFQNLIDNAYKYSYPDRKCLHIIIERVGSKVVFTFRDQGIGIEKIHIKYIFDKFYRVQNQFNQKGNIGLGLAFCKEVVQSVQGNIAVKSKVGQGSEFIITLPVDRE